MTDRYTKVALTVIAAALVAIVAQNMIAPAGAQGGIQRVILCSAENTNICASVGKYSHLGTDRGLLFVAPITK